MPDPWSQMASAQINDTVYFFGGSSGGSSRAESYNFSSDTWTDLSPLPQARTYLTAAALDGLVYVIGGWELGNQLTPYDRVDIYDPLTDSWTAGTAMHATRGYVQSCVHDGKIYAFGGLDGPFALLNSFEVFDPATNTWTLHSDTPISWATGTCVPYDGRIYLLTFGTLYSFDPAIADSADVDEDFVFDFEDNCLTPTGDGWQADSATDHDFDGCRDSDQDFDDDNDTVPDDVDDCPLGDEDWDAANTSAENDPDMDGCHNSEDPDDDNDTLLDADDDCPRGVTNWDATINVVLDPDGDGCHNDEDDDDDADGVLDADDQCAGSPLGEEVDATGCAPGTLAGSTQTNSAIGDTSLLNTTGIFVPFMVLALLAVLIARRK